MTKEQIEWSIEKEKRNAALCAEDIESYEKKVRLAEEKERDAIQRQIALEMELELLTSVS